MLANFLKLFRVTIGLDRKKFFLLIFFLMLLTILETIGVGIVIPLIAIVLDEEMLKNYDVGKLYYNFIKDLNLFSNFENFRDKIIFLSSLIVIIFFFVKFVFTVFVTYFQQFFLFSFHQSLSLSLVKEFVKRDLNFHIKKNSSELISDLIEEVNEIISVYSSYITLFTEMIIFIFVSFIVLYSIKIQGIMILLFFSIIGILILSFTRRKLVQLGKKRQLHFAQRFNSARDLFTSIKEIKILGVEDFFVEKFNLHNKELNRTAIPKRVYTVIPRTMLEFVAVFAIFLIVIALSINNENTSEEIIFVIGIIVAATVKIFPSISKIITSAQTIKFGDVAINKVSKYLDSEKYFDSQTKSKVKFEKQILLKIKKFNYPDSNITVLKNLEINIKKNQCIGVFGSSGIGKSTIVDILMGLQKLDNKENLLIVDDENIDTNLKNWQKKFGYVGQNIHFLNDTIEKNVAFGVEDKNINKELVLKSLKGANIWDFINDTPLKTKSILGEGGLNISGGQRQRLGIARALYQNPEILVFDEATNSLDDKTEKLIMQTINTYKDSKTMIIVSHKIENLSFCDQIIKL